MASILAAVPKEQDDEFVGLVDDRIAHQIRTGPEWNQQLTGTMRLGRRATPRKIQKRLGRMDNRFGGVYRSMRIVVGQKDPQTLKIPKRLG